MYTVYSIFIVVKGVCKIRPLAVAVRVRVAFCPSKISKLGSTFQLAPPPRYNKPRENHLTMTHPLEYPVPQVLRSARSWPSLGANLRSCRTG